MSLRKLFLHLPGELAFVHVATSFVEASAKALDLDTRGSASLVLAVEEVFAVAARNAAAPELLKIECRGNGYYVEIILTLHPHLLPMRAFNMASIHDLEQADADEDMGLFMAGRAVDKFFMDPQSDGKLALRFIVFRRFEAVNLNEQAPLLPSQLRGPFTSASCDEASLQALSVQAFARYGVAVPLFMRAPDMLAHMINAGNYGLVQLQNEKGYVAGAMVYGRRKALAKLFGPYVFTPEEGIAQRLVELTLQALSDENQDHRPLCAMCRRPTVEMPSDLFVDVGNGILCRSVSDTEEVAVFVPEVWQPFVNSSAMQLGMQRVFAPLAENSTSEHSALSVELDKERGEAVLRWLWCGCNAADNVSNHVEALQQQGYTSIHFQVELGSCVQASASACLANLGFTPLAFVPFGGQEGDILLLCYKDTNV